MDFRRLHPWNVSVREAAEIQKRLYRMISLADGFEKVDRIAGVDVSVPFRSTIGRAAIVILSYPELQIIESSLVSAELTFPYVPGYLSFREIPVILAAFERVEQIPDLVIVDGQGIAHPRRLGIAAHLGLLLDRPTIGCAKSRLYGRYTEPEMERGSVSPLLAPDGDKIGDVVRTRTGVKPVFISPGHKVSFESAVKFVLECTPRFRLPEPVRAAHRLAGESVDTA